MENGTRWTAPTESESGKLILVTGRKDVEKFRSNPRFNIRVEVSWKYEGDAKGMPDKETSTLMEEVRRLCRRSFTKIRWLCSPASLPATVSATGFSTL